MDDGEEVEDGESRRVNSVARKRKNLNTTTNGTQPLKLVSDDPPCKKQHTEDNSLGLSEMVRARLLPSVNEMEENELRRRRLHITPLKLDELDRRKVDSLDCLSGKQLNSGALHLKKIDSSHGASDEFDPLEGRKLTIRHT